MDETSNQPNAGSGEYSRQSLQEESAAAHERNRFLKGWRYSVTMGSLLAFIVFLLNLVTTLIFSLRPDASAPKLQGLRDIGEHTVNHDSKTLFVGDCDRAHRLNTELHLLINVLSTILLGTSNFAMQALSAPTRKEVDVAHLKRQWLDIGVLSIRNLRNVNRKRVMLWSILGLSSLPRHLFYNSAVYSTIVAIDYSVIYTNEVVVTNKTDSSSLGNDLTATTGIRKKLTAGMFERLSPVECMKAYAKPYQTARSDLILVAQNSSAETVVELYDTYNATMTDHGVDRCFTDAFWWMCSRTLSTQCRRIGDYASCGTKISKVNPEDWSPLELGKISYCLSLSIKQHCMLQFSQRIAWIVVAANLLKVLCFASIAFLLTAVPILTIGDAVSTFISDPDETTKDLCLMGKEDISWWTDSRVNSPPRPFEGQLKRWKQAISTRRWWTCIAIYASTLSLCIGLLVAGLTTHRASPLDFMGVGLGQADPRAFITWDISTSRETGFFPTVIIANLPQLVLSMVYYAYNGVFTTFWLGEECSQYAIKRKSLRVSTVKTGLQRESYFLQLPYRFSLPLMLISGILHWLCSQSLFIVSVNIGQHELINCGYSPRAITSVIGIGACMIVALFLFGRKSFASNMPLAASCSAAISALCHPSRADQNCSMATELVQWGITDHEQHLVGEGDHD